MIHTRNICISAYLLVLASKRIYNIKHLLSNLIVFTNIKWSATCFFWFPEHKCRIKYSINSDESANPRIINGDTKPLLFHQRMKGTTVLWFPLKSKISLICRKNQRKISWSPLPQQFSPLSRLVLILGKFLHTPLCFTYAQFSAGSCKINFCF